MSARPIASVFLLFLCLATQAQETRLDSLREQLKLSLADTSRVKVLNEMANYWRVNNLDSAEKFNSESLTLASQIGFENGYFDARIDQSEILQARMMTDSAALVLREVYKSSAQSRNRRHEFLSLNLLGTILSRQGKMDSAYACYKLIEKRNLLVLEERASYYSNYGMAYLMGGSYEQAKILFHKADSTAKMDGIVQARINANYNWAIAEYYLGNYATVINHAQIALKLAEQHGNLTAQASALEMISAIYQKIGDTERRLEILAEAVELHKSVGNYRSLLYSLSAKVNSHLILKEYEEVRSSAGQFFQFSDSVGSIGLLKNVVYMDLAQLYVDLKKNDSASHYLERVDTDLSATSNKVRADRHLLKAQLQLEKGESDSALVHLKDALALGRQHGLKRIVSSAAKIIYQVLENKGNIAGAYKYLKVHNVYKDSLLSEEKLKDLTRLQVEFEAEEREKLLLAEKEKETLILQANVERQSLLRRSTFVVSSIVLVSLLGMFWFLYDRRKKKQLLLQEKHDQLQVLSRLKNRYFTNIAHELRTPLSLILGPVDDVIDSSGLNTQAQRKLKIASRSGKNMLQLINEMLDLTKLQKGKVDLQTVPTDLEDYIRTLTAPFQALAELKQLDFALEYMPMIQYTVMLDQQKLQKIIYNLLANAFKFTPQNGRVVVVLDIDSNDSIVIKVKDTGKGISAQDLPHIFDAYYQTSEGRTQQVGTGIGLALSRELTQLMGGSIEVDSMTAKGTTFTLTIPFVKAAEGAETTLSWEDDWAEMPTFLPEDDQEVSISGKRTILLVEDHPDMADYVKSVLQDQYEIVLTENGLKALEVLKSGIKVDLIISDVMMPEMDGFELLAAVRRAENLRTLPFILLTARADQEDRLKGLLTGVDEYMTKPFDQRELKLRVANLLKNQLARKEAVEKECPENESKSVSKEDLHWVEALEQILHRELANTQFNMTSLADELAMSERNLRYRLKKVTGLSPYNYFREIKLKKGQELLESRTYQTVAQVAYKVGFEDPKHFSKLFFQRFGKRPSQYLFSPRLQMTH